MFAAVLAVYALTLAPTVTFWDAGEFIASARALGIPHPPGTPLFVLIAHVWAMLLPLGEYAVRTNLLSAIFSAAGAALFFLVVHESLGRPDAEDARGASGRLAAAALAALVGAFTFTNWQNSNETEVYAVATFTIAAVSWLALVWRRRRTEERAGRLLLLVVYLAGTSIGNHLLALLAGPGIVAFLVVTLLRDPAPEPWRRRLEWGQVAVVAGVWALLIGTGLGSTELITIGGACFLAAAVYAAMGGAGGFALAALLIAAVGVTPYLYMYLRAAQHPVINEAAPATFDALLAVIRRAQYPPRTPLDDPTVPHGPGNPGRTLSLLGWQLLNYFQYFDWQWARSLADGVRTVVTVLFVGLGLRGMRIQWRSDRAAAWLLLGLFLVTGLGLVVYMNFRPGYSLAYHLWPKPDDHEVRERDYFFVVSFIVWGLWAGIGAAGLFGSINRPALRRWQPAALLLALVPLGLNWSDASRRHGPDARLAADFAYDLLNSVPPYGVLFTYGDNDTFPLWWAQEVQGIRQDVTVVCLALANTDWYMRQLRDQPTRAVDAAGLPAVWRDSLALRLRPDWPLHDLSDSMIDGAMNGYVVPDTQRIALGPLERTLDRGAFLYPSEIVSLSIIQRNVGRRPITWSITAGRGYAGLGDYVVQAGLGFSLGTLPPDSGDTRLDFRRLASAPLDVSVTQRLVFDTYRYADLLQAGALDLEPTAKSVAGSLALPPVQLVYAYQAREDRKAMERALRYAEALSPNPDLRAALLDLLYRPAE
ncbi:MAG: protein O-mannosyl-transferase family [Gemmatimonadales bacterium]